MVRCGAALGAVHGVVWCLVLLGWDGMATEAWEVGGEWILFLPLQWQSTSTLRSSMCVPKSRARAFRALRKFRPGPVACARMCERARVHVCAGTCMHTCSCHCSGNLEHARARISADVRAQTQAARRGTPPVLGTSAGRAAVHPTPSANAGTGPVPLPLEWQGDLAGMRNHG